MTHPRQLHLGAFLRPVSIHTGAWRYPGAFADANFNIAHYLRFARKLEDGKFDAIFLADHMALLNMPIEALRRSATVASFEPLTLLSVGPLLDSPDRMEARRVRCTPGLLEVDIDVSASRQQGVQLRRNVGWHPLAMLALSLPAGDFDQAGAVAQFLLPLRRTASRIRSAYA